MLWTDLSCTEIKDRLKDQGIEVSRRIVKNLLYKNHFKKRKIQRRRAMKQVANRNQQFERTVGGFVQSRHCLWHHRNAIL